MRELDLHSLGIFEGTNRQLDYHRLFGGQLLAQFVRAARLTCPGKAVKSLHAALRPLDGYNQRGNGMVFTAAVTSPVPAQEALLRFTH